MLLLVRWIKTFLREILTHTGRCARGVGCRHARSGCECFTAIRSVKETAQKRLLELALVLLSAFSALVLLLNHFGVIDHWRGLDKVQEVADRFDLSYAPEASRPVYPQDSEWKPTMELIEKYSTVKWPVGREPQTIARMKADFSTHDLSGHEWTAPSTPIVVLFRHWPGNSGKSIPQEDFRVVGTIGDLHSWIAQSKDEFNFWLSDCPIAVLLAALGYWLWRINYSAESRHRRERI